jgi:hypothetical protein
MTEYTTPLTLYKTQYDADAPLPKSGSLREDPLDLRIVGEIGVSCPLGSRRNVY